MALRLLPRRGIAVRRFCTSPAPLESKSSSSRHDFLPPSSFIGSWKTCRDPKEAAAQLDLLRRNYNKKFKEMRKEYVQEMEMQRIEKSRKDEARNTALRIANEERRAAKDAKKKAEAIERKAAEQEFRELLMKERAEKLEYWREREGKISEKKAEKRELLRRQSSLWIDEKEIERKAVEAIGNPANL